MTQQEQCDIVNELSAKLAEELAQPINGFIVWFTGWKPGFEIKFIDKKLQTVTNWDGGTVAQWVAYSEEKQKGYYVNLPGKQGGEFKKDQCFDIGESRLHIEDMSHAAGVAEAIRWGFWRLKELIEAAE